MNSSKIKIDSINTTKSKYYHFANLDGLRALAAFCVISAHLSYWMTFPQSPFYQALKQCMSLSGTLGRVGVISFFVLSGFLITHLMFSEESIHGKVNVLYFYLRRILRIWPLYFATLFIGFVVYPAIVRFYGIEFHENVNWVMYVAFAANFEHIWHAWPATSILGVQWSVGVEEQFYLIWPLIFSALSHKKKIFPWFLFSVILFSEFFSFKIETHMLGGDYHFLSCIKYLSIGALLAYLCFTKPAIIKSFFVRINKGSTLAIYIIFCLIICFWENINQIFPTYVYLYHIPAALFAAFIIAEQNYSPNSFFKIGSSSVLTWLGKISYGLYLLHMVAINIIIIFFPKNENYLFLKMLLSVLLCIAISHFSYNYFEKYFIRLKEKFY